MGQIASNSPMYHLSSEIYSNIFKYLKILLLSKPKLSKPGKIANMLLKYQQLEYKALIDLESAMETPFLYDRLLPGSIGQYTLKILIRNYFTTEIDQWMNVSTKLDFFSKCGEYQLAYIADKLAKVFIKHLFDGIDKKYESTDLFVNMDTLFEFKNKLNYAVMEEVKSLP